MQDVKTPTLNPLRLWFVTIGPPAIWGAHYYFVWALVEMGCRLGLQNNQWLGINAVHAVVFLASPAAVALTTLAGVMAYRDYRKIRAAEVEDSFLHARALERGRFMTLIGIGFSLIFLVIIVYVTVPVFVLSPCS